MPQASRRTLLAGAMVVAATATAAAGDKATQPIEGKKGATVLGPRDPTRANENPNFFQPPATDHGALPNLRYSFADTHIKMREGGWSREVTARELPAAKTIAGVNMRLAAGGVRELHWHKEAEWAFMLAGKARITAVDNDGHNFVADVEPGDLWYFPSGIPHSIQGLQPDGAEFLLAFPNGSFSEDSTFAITDLFAHLPKEVLAKNFGTNQAAFDHIPKEERFIFEAPLPPSLQDDIDHERARTCAAGYEVQPDGANADADIGRHGADRRHAQFPGFKRYCRRAGRGRARPDSRDSLASKCR